MVVSKASDYISLKARIKKEVLRRKYTGTVETYGSSTYDFTVTPVVGADVKIEHYNKINTPTRAINPSGLLTDVSIKDAIRDVSTLDAKVTIFESKKLTSSSSDTGCSSSCTGLCSTTCTGTCSTGCTSCTGCSGCGSACSSNCTGCTNSCSGCGGACSYGCGDGCTSCSGGCSNACGGGCANTCNGCDWYCAVYAYYSLDSEVIKHEVMHEINKIKEEE